MNDSERQIAIARFEDNRRFSRELFENLAGDAYYDQPIPLRNPIVFYEGHFSAFNLITLVKRALGKPGVDEDLEDLFERGIDPEDEAGADSTGVIWPSRAEVLEYTEEVDLRVRDALTNEGLEDDDNPLLVRAESVYTMLEHELMHHETFLYMMHQLPLATKTPLHRLEPVLGGAPPSHAIVTVPEGVATLGADRNEIRFGWDNEFEKNAVEVQAFEVDTFPVTNRDFLAFVEEGGYLERELWGSDGWQWIQDHALRHPIFWERTNAQWMWRGQYGLYPLPESWPVWVSHAEASAFAKWKGRRIMTEPEFHRAAFGTPEGFERPFPWGEEAPDNAKHGNFEYKRFDPMPVDAHPEGASAWGIHDLIGNGWEWTSTEFGPFPGFREMASYPPYSSDFFDGAHFVMKGASPVTSRDLIRRSFRNWFRNTYPYMYAKFRLAG